MFRLMSHSLLLLSALCLAADPGLAQTLREQQRSLDLLRGKMEEIGRSLEQKESRERSLLQDLEELETRSGILEGHQRQLEKELEASRREQAAEEERAARLRRLVETLENQVRRRVGAIYRGSGDEFWQIAFSPASPGRKAEDLFYLRRIVRRDRELLREYQKQMATLEASLERIATLERRQKEQLQVLQENRAVLKQAGRLKQELVARARRDRDRLAGELEELRRREEQLLELIKRLETEKSQEYIEKSVTFASLKGKLPWPVAGSLRTGFGPWKHPELGTLHESQGIEIEVGPGAEIRAVAPGRVVFASPFKGYGRLVIVNHGSGYYTLYARGEELRKSVGDPVAAGETVAATGPETAGAVYFEIRHHRTPVDPLEWFSGQAVERKD